MIPKHKVLLVFGLFSVLFFTLLATAPLPSSQAQAPAGFGLLDSRSQSRIRTFRTQVIENSADWQKLWQEHLGQTGQTGQAPAVDFSKERIAAIFLGVRPTAGYSVAVESVEVQTNQILVRYREAKPQPDQFVATVLTAPACLIKLPKTAITLPITFINSEPEAVKIQAKDPISMRTLSRVSNSRVTEARYVIARDYEQFRQLWKEHNGSLEQLPEVDFQSEMVAGIFMGERSTGGYAVTIEEVLKEGEKFKFYYSESEPPEGSMTIQILTAPAHLIALPRSEAYPEFVKRDKSK
ncbi:MAG: protease complex subunit PrcB family protein [Candidatus Sericytochromatia bacterium]|nr:protease complex subunit PrcB family protein [Candidatus Sericytochromatia bacterium]